MGGANESVAGDVKWQAISQRISELLAHVDGATARDDAPSEHDLHGEVRQLKRKVASGATVIPPSPHWKGRLQMEDQRNAAAEFTRDRHDGVEERSAA